MRANRGASTNTQPSRAALVQPLPAVSLLSLCYPCLSQDSWRFSQGKLQLAGAS